MFFKVLKKNVKKVKVALKRTRKRLSKKENLFTKSVILSKIAKFIIQWQEFTSSNTKLLKSSRKKTQIKEKLNSLSLSKKDKIEFSLVKNYTKYIIVTDFENNVIKNLKLLKKFCLHARTYKFVVTQALFQLKSLLEFNFNLTSIFKQLRIINNTLIAKQTSFKSILKKQLKRF